MFLNSTEEGEGLDKHPLFPHAALTLNNRLRLIIFYQALDSTLSSVLFLHQSLAKIPLSLTAAKYILEQRISHNLPMYPLNAIKPFK